MRAVIWTDVFQCAVMFGGLLAIIIKVSKMGFSFDISGNVACSLFSLDSLFSNQNFSLFISKIKIMPFPCPSVVR